MKLLYFCKRQLTQLFIMLIAFFAGSAIAFSQSVSLPTDRARVTIAEIPDYYNAAGPKLKVLRTDSNTPLRGGTAWIWEKQGQEEPESYYKLMSSKGINAVRMILFDTWEVETYTPSASFNPTDWNDAAYRTRQLARMERAVNYASKYGMYIIINSHNHIPQYNEAYVNTLWTYVAPYFANRTHVLYELANEPMNGIGKNGDIDMGAAGALQSPRLQALKRTYNITRAASPNTMLLILTPPGINDFAFGTGMGNLADSFAKLPGEVDWTKTAVAYHLYNNDAAYGAATKAKNLRNLHQRYAGWPSENSFPPGVNGLLNTDEWRSPSFDNDLYVNQTCEKLGIGWDMWFINGTTQFNANFPVMWADAVAKGWAWSKDVITPQVVITGSGESLPNNSYAKLKDELSNTTWIAASSTTWLRYELAIASKMNTYSLTTGSDATKDPKDWTLQASTDGNTWVILNTQTNQNLAARSTKYAYSFVNENSYKYYKIDITANGGNASTELAELAYSYIDIIKPGVPKNLQFSNTSFVLSWTASTDNVGVASYEVFNNGISMAKTPTNTYSLTGVIPNADYSFTIKVVDNQGNWSELSSVLKVNSGIFTNYEAENATISGGLIATDHPGFTGSGFWGNVGTVGNNIEFTVNSEAGGSTDISCRYSSGTSVKTMNLYVNGEKVRQVSFPNTTSWDAWGTKVDNVTLNAGNNTIKYQYDTGNTGYINVDYISIKANATGLIQNTDNQNFIIYPNPASETITISNIDYDTIVSICSLDGKIIYEQQSQSSKTLCIDVSTFKKGLYLISIKNGVKAFTKLVSVV